MTEHCRNKKSVSSWLGIWKCLKTMKVLIDIDEKEYEDYKETYDLCKKYGCGMSRLYELVGSGVPISADKR